MSPNWGIVHSFSFGKSWPEAKKLRQLQTLSQLIRNYDSLQLQNKSLLLQGASSALKLSNNSLKSFEENFFPTDSDRLQNLNEGR